MGGSGGGSSGAISYPGYMQNWHSIALRGVDSLTGGGDTVTVSLTEAMNFALDGLSPYSGFILPDADEILLGAGKTIGDFTAPFTYLTAYTSSDFITDFTNFKANSVLATYLASKDANLAALVAAESALLDNDITINVLPQFNGGLRDINAVLSSAFVIGTSNIYAQKELALAKTDASIRLDAERFYADLALRVEAQAMSIALNAIEVRKGIAVTVGEFAKIYAAMKTELSDWQLENVAKDKLWDLKVYQFGGNFLGSIAGSTSPTDSGTSRGNKLGATVAGALGGAVSGYMLGSSISSGSTTNSSGTTTSSGNYGGWGAAIGAVAGGLMSYYSNNN